MASVPKGYVALGNWFADIRSAASIDVGAISGANRATATRKPVMISPMTARRCWKKRRRARRVFETGRPAIPSRVWTGLASELGLDADAAGSHGAHR